MSQGATRFAIEDFWVDGDGDNWIPAIERAQNSIPRATYIELQLGPRRYPCSSVLNVYRGLTLIGTGARNSTNESCLYFNNSTAGIVSHYPGSYATDILAGSYLHLENVCVRGSGAGVGTSLNGIQLYTAAILTDVYIDGFSGSGIYINASTGNADLVVSTVANNTAYTVTIGGTPYSITSDGSATAHEIRNALLVALQAQSNLIPSANVVAISSVADATTYTVTIDGTPFSINSGAGATALSIRNALMASIDGGSLMTSYAVSTSSFTIISDTAASHTVTVTANLSYTAQDDNKLTYTFSSGTAAVTATSNITLRHISNANNWRVKYCTVRTCGGHGIHVEGSDANAGSALESDFSGNTGYGVYDSSFLGNTYVGVHCDSNLSGDYWSDDANSRSIFIGCYTEGVGTTSKVEPPAMVIGGFLNPHSTMTGDWLYHQGGCLTSRNTFAAFGSQGASVVQSRLGGLTGTTAWEWFTADAPTDIFRMQRGLFTNWWSFAAQNSSALAPLSFTTAANVFEGPGQIGFHNGFYFGNTVKNAIKTDAIGGINVIYHTTNVTIVSAATAASPIAVTCSSAHLGQTGNRVRIGNAVGLSGLNTTSSITRTGANTFTFDGTTGTGTWTSGGIVELRRAIGWSNAAPTSGTWYVGDVVYNQSPSATAAVGWICTAIGTPGTWKELERPNNTVQSATYGTGSIDNAKVEMWRIPFSAGAAGTADDVTIFNANCPGAIRILRYDLLVSTAIALSTAELRTASGGGGSLLFETNDTATTGTRTLLTSTTTETVSNNGSLFFRRSDRGIAGELILYVSRT